MRSDAEMTDEYVAIRTGTTWHVMVADVGSSYAIIRWACRNTVSGFVNATSVDRKNAHQFYASTAEKAVDQFRAIRGDFDVYRAFPSV